MKLIFIFLILLFLNFINCQNSLDEEQNKAALKLISDVYGETTDDPCNFFGFSCTSIDSEGGIQTIVSIQLQSKQAYLGNGFALKRSKISNDLTVFKDLQYIELLDIEVTSDFFYTLDNFKKLNILRIYTHSSPITKNFKLPSSLTLLNIRYFGGKLVGGFFNGNLNTLEIKNSLNGFDITDGSDILDNTKLSVLTFPIVSNNTQLFMNSISIKFKNLNRLILILDESTVKIKRDIQIPTFKAKTFKSLSFLNIYFQTGSLEKPNFPYSINNLVNLSQLIFNSNQYTLDTSKPYIDFSGINKGLLFRSTSKCDYLNYCKIKPCIKFPKGSTVNIQDCGNFDYSNIQISSKQQVIKRNTTIEIKN